MKEPAGQLPNGLLVTWYGDDFTGASAVLEVLTLAGLPSVLFLEIPTAALLEKFSDYRGLGIAGVARSKSPKWMETHLPPVFQTLAQWAAPIAHYKICSTFDSAPHVGSIGKAIELAGHHFNSSWVPILTAAPAIQRYQLYGNLFAAGNGVGYRLDRHPTMSRHPVTPMTEADVRVHLSRQTDAAIGLIDYPALIAQRAEQVLDQELKAGRRLVAIDTLDESSLAEAGKLIWNRRSGSLFAVGSQGIEYALVAYWRSVGALSVEAPPARARAVERMVVVSGSCSPITAGQIEWAQAHGFELIRLDVRRALDERAWQLAISDAVGAAVRAVDNGRDPLVYSARGPDDPSVGALFEAVKASGKDIGVVNENIGTGMGKILDSVFRRTHLRRGVLAGGDTSGYGAKVLGVRALTLIAPVSPGAALLRPHSDDPLYGNLEIALKGGQMGPPDYFGQIKNGGPGAH
jgi:3-oxoisoapionate kinase